MDWRDYIHSADGLLGGKPVFRGTRYTVERVLKLVGAGWTCDQIADEYPGIISQHLRAAAAFSAHMMQNDDFVAIERARAA